MKPEPLFYIERDQNVAGPYDLVQMAGLLRRKIIDDQTPTRLKGEDGWMPFSWQPQFSVVREIPADAVSARVDELDAAAEEARQGPIPLPSAETVMKLVGLVLCTLAAGVVSFFLAWLNQTLGYCLLIAGIGSAAIAFCLAIARMMDEDGWTQMKIVFLPYYDIFYLLSNFWAYFPMMCIRSIGVAVAVGAAIGLATHPGH
jgi:hypothetical protein